MVSPIKLIIAAVAALVIWYMAVNYLGFAGGTLTTILFVGASLLLLQYFGLLGLPIPIAKQMALILAIGGFIAVFLLGGFSGILQLGEVGQAPAPTAAGCYDGVSDETRGLASTLYLDAWNLEADSPYATAIDFATSCWVYRKVDGTLEYVATTADTSAATLSNVANVGDVVKIYCGGTTYYGEQNPVEICVEKVSKPVSFDGSAVVSTLQSVGYDSTGSAALTAGTSWASDYNITMGAGEEIVIYVNFKANEANKAFQFGALAIVKFFNISEVKPVSDSLGGTYTEVVTPTAFEGQAVAIGASTINKDYIIYKRNAPLMLHEWDEVKVKFSVKSHATNDPIDSVVTNTSFNGFAIIFTDVQNARGADGMPYFDIHDHTTTEANVGFTETLTSPLGKDDGVLVRVV